MIKNRMAGTLIVLIVFLLPLAHGGSVETGSTDANSTGLKQCNSIDSLIENEQWEDLCNFQTQGEDFKYLLMMYGDESCQKVIEAWNKILDYLKSKTEGNHVYDCPTSTFTNLANFLYDWGMLPLLRIVYYCFMIMMLFNLLARCVFWLAVFWFWLKT